MAPVKFGLFKGRSKDYPEPPSTENLLQNSCTDLMVSPPSPIPSTSKGLSDDGNGFAEFSLMHLDSEDEDESENLPQTRHSGDSKLEEAQQINYKPLPSTNATSTTTLQESYPDSQYQCFDDMTDLQNYNYQNIDSPDDATSIDANSIQFDENSIISEDVKYCGATKKQKKYRSKEEQQAQEQQKDLDMWQASNNEVLQHLLSRSGTLDDQIKWEAIATARGLCTLRATCTCKDCSPGKSPASVTDGDAGIGAAPLFGAVTVGCQVQ